MNANQLFFIKNKKVEIHEHKLPELQPNQVLVKNLYSAVSAGTEMLVYRGQIPDNMALDENLVAFNQQENSYPLQYGYACVGEIEDIGEDGDATCIGNKVFSFQPHASHHVCEMKSVINLPRGIDPKEAVFLANMETAVNLVQDANPHLGDRVIVMGQGVVGLLVSSILAEFPLASLDAVETLASRRILSVQAGTQETFSPASNEDITALKDKLKLRTQPNSNDSSGGADVVFELTGSPAALNMAIDFCAYAGRIVVGSWYGTKSAHLNLGTRFHRNRINIMSSQVSTIAPELSGRWDKERRFSVTWEMIKKCHPAQFISHCIPFTQAEKAYQLLDDSPQDALQVIFDYQQ